MNNSTSATTGRSPNEIIYGFKLREGLDLTIPYKEDESPEALRALHRQEAADCIAWAQAKMKLIYDSHHKPVHLKEGDMAYINLHKGYKVLSRTNRKFSAQRMGPFRVIRARGNQAYELDLPDGLIINPVISIASLTPAPNCPNPFDRRQEPWHPPAVNEEGDTEILLIDGRRTRRGRGKYLEYHVRFKGYDDEPGEWVREDMITQEAKAEYDAKHPRPPLPKEAPKETSAAPIPEQPVKRKRGRPRKNPLPSQA